MCDLNDFFLYTTTTKGTLFNGNQLSKYVSNQKRPSCQGYWGDEYITQLNGDYNKPL